MASKAQEIKQGAHLPACPGPSGSCSMHPRADRVPEWKLWAFSLAFPGVSPWR